MDTLFVWYWLLGTPILVSLLVLPTIVHAHLIKAEER